MNRACFATGVIAGLIAFAPAATAGTLHPAWLERQASAPPTTPPAPVAAPSGSSSLQLFDTLAAFQTATAAMTITLDDFSIRQANNVSPCYEPINHEMGQPGTSLLAPVCFEPGQAAPGYSIRSDLGVGAHGFGTMAFGSLTIGVASNVVGSIAPAEVTLIDFLDGPVAVAMDAYDWQAGSPLTFTVVGGDGTVLGEFTRVQSSPTTPAFAGFISAEPVRRVTIRSAAATTRMIGNLRFGGRPGRIAVGSATLDFGAVALDETGTATLALSNGGDVALAVPALPALPAPFALAADGCSGVVLAPGADCALDIDYAPLLEGSDRLDWTAIEAGDDEPVAVRLDGRGVAPTLALAAEPYHFGVVPVGGDSGTHTVRVFNPVAVPVRVTGVQSPAAPFQFVAGGCPPVPFELAPGEGCELGVRFAPTTAGSHSARMLIESDEAGSPRRLLLRGLTDDLIFGNGFE